MRAVVGISILGVLLQVGCKDASAWVDPAQRQAEHKQEVAAEAKQVVRDQEQQDKQQLLANPDAFLETSDLIFYDKGIINDYRQLMSLTVLNKSKYAVKDMSGEIDWLDNKGAKFGTIPFSLTGSLAGGDTKKFSTTDRTLANGTLQGGATKARIRFTRISLVQP